MMLFESIFECLNLNTRSLINLFAYVYLYVGMVSIQSLPALDFLSLLSLVFYDDPRPLLPLSCHALTPSSPQPHSLPSPGNPKKGATPSEGVKLNTLQHLGLKCSIGSCSSTSHFSFLKPQHLISGLRARPREGPGEVRKGVTLVGPGKLIAIKRRARMAKKSQL